jgi:hypothetical protein
LATAADSHRRGVALRRAYGGVLHPSDYGALWSMAAYAAMIFPLIFLISALVTAILAGVAY